MSTVDTDEAKSRVSSLPTPLDHDSNDKTSCCTHPQVFGEECHDCSQHVGADYGIAFGYIRQGLRLSQDEVTRLRDLESKRLLSQKKLHLVLDIDHTLVHSIKPKDLKPEEKACLKENAESLQECLFERESTGFLVKLRPFVHTFLKEASSMFEMYLYIMGASWYAMDIAQLLDPEGTYFGKRIISSEDCPGYYKTLDLVLGHESEVLILDDTRGVWPPRERNNLILMERYHYFAKSNSPHRYSETGTDESESSGALANILKVLKEIHKLYFDHQLNADCRNVVKSLRCSILEGCTLYFDEVDHEEISRLSRGYPYLLDGL